MLEGRNREDSHTLSHPQQSEAGGLLSCHLSAAAEKSCSGFLGLRGASSGENWGFVALGVFVF